MHHHDECAFTLCIYVLIFPHRDDDVLCSDAVKQFQVEMREWRKHYDPSLGGQGAALLSAEGLRELAPPIIGGAAAAS